MDRYCDYLTANDHAEEARWVRAEDAAMQAMKDIGNNGLDRSVFGARKMLQLTGFWLANIITLSNALWMLVFGGVAIFLSRRRLTKGRVPLEVFVGWFAIAAAFIVWNLPSTQSFATMLTVTQNLTETN